VSAANALHRAGRGVGIVHRMRQYSDQLHPAGRPIHTIQDGSSMRPYLTLVTFVRNDDYTNDYLVRVRRAWSFLISQIERHRLEAEIVIVEWNPPGGRPLVSELLECPPDGGYVLVSRYGRTRALERR
jgi:hypothetical protein